MTKAEKHNDPSFYQTPQVIILTVSVYRCIATSVSGSTESFTGESHQTEGFKEVGQGDL